MLASRIALLRKHLQQQKLDAVFISSLANCTYLTNFSGFSTEDRDVFLLITKTKQYIFTHGIYHEAVKKHIANFELIPIQRENPISKTIKQIIEQENIQRLGFESFDLKVNEYEQITKHINNNILIPTTIVHILRQIKTANEKRSIKKACVLGDKVFTSILNELQIGITEKDIALKMEYFMKHQHADIAFPSVVAFGKNASNPHHTPTNTKLKKNNLVLLDFGVKRDNYCSDITRTVFFGKATQKQKKVYETVLAAQQLAIKKIKQQVTMQQSEHRQTQTVDKVAREYITACGYPSMPHSLGHGIGLEVHESPRLTPSSQETLHEGMVFSIEPGIYLPGKFGIRIEDLFTIQNNTLIQLTKSPRKLIEI